jgi:predicted acetyltransferase
MTIDVRTVREEEFDAWSDALDIGFHSPKYRGDGPRRRKMMDLARCTGAFDEGKPVATFRSIEMQLTVPGGGFVPMTGVSAVTVLPTHRRRGLLSRLMALEFDTARERGEALAGLYAAEYPIYGRFGYGPAVEAGTWELDARAARFTRELPGTIEVITAEEARTIGAEVYDAVRAITPGAVTRGPVYWERALGFSVREGDNSVKENLNAVVRDDDGRAVGYVRYRFGEENWTHQRPDNVVKALDLLAVNVEYEARLWKFLADHDWVSRVVAEEVRRGDELWRDLLVNRRVVWPSEQWEGLWLRVLDPAAALAARRYEVPGRFVLRVVDKDGYADGTFAVEGGPDGAACEPTGQSPDVTLPVSVLGSILLGGLTARRFAHLGMLDEHRAGAVGGLSAMFQTGIAPWAPTGF